MTARMLRWSGPVGVGLAMVAWGAAMLAGGAGIAWSQGAEGAEAQPIRGAVSVVAESVYVLEVGAELEKRTSLTVLDPGESLRTDATGAAFVTWFYDGTETVLGQNTRVTLHQFEGTADDAYTIDLTLDDGHIVAGLGTVAGSTAGGSFIVRTSDLSVRLLSGQLEVSAAGAGASMVAVTFGEAEVRAGQAAPVRLGANEVFQNGEKGTLTSDGVTPALESLCTTTANTNLVVRMYPSENSQRLGGVPSGQALWVRAATEGRLWLQIGYATDPLQTDLFNYGWVYGPATTLGANCDAIPRAVLDAQLYGGAGASFAEPAPTADGDGTVAEAN